MAQPTDRLLSQLNQTQLAQKDNPVYQVIKQLIDRIKSLESAVGSSGSTTNTTIEQTIQQIFQLGDDSGGGEGGGGIPGERGQDGIPGATGPVGPAGPETLGPMNLEPDSPEEPMMIPGGIGPQGNPGVTGAAGPQAIGFVLEGEPGEDGLIIPTVGSSGGGSDWDFTIENSADFDVTNSTIQVGVPDLIFAVNSGEVWLIESLIIYAGNGTGVDMRSNAIFPQATGIYQQMSLTTADAASLTGVRVNAATALTTVSVGTRSSLSALECFRMYIMLWFSASGNFQITQANQNAGVGNITRIKAGSILRGRKLI